MFNLNFIAHKLLNSKYKIVYIIIINTLFLFIFNSNIFTLCMTNEDLDLINNNFNNIHLINSPTFVQQEVESFINSAEIIENQQEQIQNLEEQILTLNIEKTQMQENKILDDQNQRMFEIQHRGALAQNDFLRAKIRKLKEYIENLN